MHVHYISLPYPMAIRKQDTITTNVKHPLSIMKHPKMTHSRHKNGQQQQCPHCHQDISTKENNKAAHFFSDKTRLYAVVAFLNLSAVLLWQHMQIMHSIQEVTDYDKVLQHHDIQAKLRLQEQQVPIQVADERKDMKEPLKIKGESIQKNDKSVNPPIVRVPPQKVATAQQSISNSPNSGHHAIIVPYRNRPYHYEKFIPLLDEYLSTHFDTTRTEFSLYIVEQDDQEPFNRAWLGNVGLTEIFQRQPQTQCITFHDIDLIPDTNPEFVKGPVWYHQCDRPTQIGSELSHFNWTVPYPESAGGVTTLSQTHWKQINGFSNDYVGWGGEDDDFFKRLYKNRLLDRMTTLMHRPPTGYGRFKTISQETEHHVRDANYQGKMGNQSTPSSFTYQYNISLQLLGQMESARNKRWKYDGLSDLQYTIHSSTEQPGPKGGLFRIFHLKARQQLLEFVHIPKTAGSSIEQAAGTAGIPWGACHFQHASNAEMNCPDPPNFEGLQLKPRKGSSRKRFPAGTSLWHVPPHLWNINLLYSQKKFTVVRNPYSMAVSIYYDKWVGYQGKENRSQPATLNSFLQTWFAAPPNPLFTLCQADYVLHHKTNATIIEHVLKFETLDRDFAALMKQYDLQDRIRLPPSHHTNEANLVGGEQKLTVHDLDATTRQLIEKHYARDFELFGYEKISA